MKLSENWLREWVNPDISTEQLCHQITMAGLEVDAIEKVAPEHSGVVIGKILTADAHPDADKLQLCSVDVGELSDEPLQIVCGAANARPGIKVACAMIKAVLPGNFKIKKSKLRGVESFGMLCSAKELGLAENSDGILELDEQAPVGISIKDYYQLNDHSIEIGLTPNRSDCLSVEGVAREVAVITEQPYQGPEINTIAVQIDDQIAVEIEAESACPAYCCRIIKGIDSSIKTPLWMVEKLRRSDVRSLSLLVDITNYVMLELGQPMHAFDYQKINDKIKVRLSTQGESIELLDGQQLELDASTLLIADADKPLAIAGIMGGMESSVTDQTVDIILESAYFDPVLLAGKARQLGLHTDSSHRFERGVSPKLQQRAIERATSLILALAGGHCGPVVCQQNEDFFPKHIGKEIILKKASIEKVLGVKISDTDIEKMLNALEMSLAQKEDSWLVIPPPFRFDISIDADLIEEIARLYGYDNLPLTPIKAAISMKPETETAISVNQLKSHLISLDYFEVINYSFVDPVLQKLIDSESDKIDLSNPISEDLSQMRSTLWPGLIKNLIANQNRQQNRIRLFEIGTRFVRENNQVKEINTLAVICSGTVYPEQWGTANSKIDFFDVKADLESLLSLGGDFVSCDFKVASHQALHPGQTARIYKNNKPIGWIGSLHPQLMKQLSIKQQAIVFELDIEEIIMAKIPAFKTLSKFQANRRDIAIIVDKSYTSLDIIKTIRDNSGSILKNVLLFDAYTSEQIDAENKKSLALGLTIQSEDKTLTDDEIEKTISQILNKLETEFGAKLRD